MTATFPGGVKSFTTKSDGVSNKIYAAHVNDLQDEVTAIETELKKTTGSVVDHGGLAGLADNDHPQYSRTGDGDAHSYKLYTTTSAGNLLIRVYDRLGAGYPVATEPAVFNVNGVIYSITGTQNLSIGGSDYFKWVANGVAGNDSQLFIYAIDNNGNFCFGASPCPSLTVVANYCTNGGTQVGSTGYTNMRVNATTFTTGSPCRVIGRINVQQGVGTTWVNPTIAKVVTGAIYSTDTLSQTPKYGTASVASSLAIRYLIDGDKCTMHINGSAQSITGAGTHIAVALPTSQINIPYPVLFYLNNSGWVLSNGNVNLGAVNLYKTIGGGAWLGTETAIDIRAFLEYFIQ